MQTVIHAVLFNVSDIDVLERKCVMTVTELAPSALSREAREELRLLSAVESAPNGVLILRRVVANGQHQTLGAGGWLVPRDVGEAYQRLAELGLVQLDVEQFVNASGRIETARARLTDAGTLRLVVLRR